MRRFFAIGCTVALCAALAGCYESSNVVLHKAGKYKGKSDSAAIMHSTDEQRAALLERFRQVQTDR